MCAGFDAHLLRFTGLRCQLTVSVAFFDACSNLSSFRSYFGTSLLRKRITFLIARFPDFADILTNKAFRPCSNDIVTLPIKCLVKMVEYSGPRSDPNEPPP